MKCGNVFVSSVTSVNDDKIDLHFTKRDNLLLMWYAMAESENVYCGQVTVSTMDEEQLSEVVTDIS